MKNYEVSVRTERFGANRDVTINVLALTEIEAENYALEQAQIDNHTDKVQCLSIKEVELPAETGTGTEKKPKSAPKNSKPKGKKQ